jgi:hypothetical protein
MTTTKKTEKTSKVAMLSKAALVILYVSLIFYFFQILGSLKEQDECINKKYEITKEEKGELALRIL